MSNLIPFPDGGYAFIKGGFPYCQGVRAQAGYTIERVRFARPLPVAQGFAAIEAYLKSAGRPRTALCAAELRSPKPFSLAGFGSFNTAPDRNRSGRSGLAMNSFPQATASALPAAISASALAAVNPWLAI